MNHNLQHVVVWDGTPNRPGGRLLFAAEPPAVEAIGTTLRPSERGSVTAAVRALRPTFGADWFTLRQVRDLAHCSNYQAHNALNNLRRQGDIERERKPLLRGRRLTDEQRYRFRVQQ